MLIINAIEHSHKGRSRTGGDTRSDGKLKTLLAGMILASR